jgi:hypothetical protein
MKNLRKKNQTEILEIKISLNKIKNTVVCHASRLQVKDRISGLKDNPDFKEKKQKNSQSKDSRSAKGTYKYSVTPSKTKPVSHEHQSRIGTSKRYT